jgi:hypothetical protein
MFFNIIWITAIHTNNLRALSQLGYCIYFHLPYPLYDLFRLKSIVKHSNHKSFSELLCSTNWQCEAVTHKSGFNIVQSVRVMHDFKGPTSDTSFDRTMALGSTQTLTKMSTRSFRGGIKAAGV